MFTKLFFLALTLFPLIASAQLVNMGEKLFIANGGVIYVSGHYIHKSGIDINNGRLVIEGNVNNFDANSRVFDIRSVGTVVLNGVNQKVTGNQISFPNLSLGGSGIKYLETSVDVFQSLDLTDREFVINSHELIITNPTQLAIKRTSGFVNTDFGGKLIRNVGVNNQYLFPLGSSVHKRYRPVIVSPKDVNGLFGITLFNSDPNLAGFNRASKRADIKNVYDKYWYKLDQVSGGTKTDVTFLTSSTDGLGSQLVNWSNFNLWEKASPSNLSTGQFGDALNQSYVHNSNAKLTNRPFSFADEDGSQTGPLTFFNAFSPDGDGKNDTWVIKNIELFPDNDVVIINRWGDEVYRAKTYNQANAWNGGSLSSGTYYYILNVTVDGARRTYKGFITMVKD